MEHDDLTGLPNRRRFNRIINNYIGTTNIVFITIDLDHFKAVNDAYGHQEGVKILVEFSTVLSETIRSSDYAYRWGGEEFVVTLIDTTLEKGIEIAERIRRNVENHNFGISTTLTASSGLVLIPESATLESLKTYFRSADDALYSAKEMGRNRVCSVV